MAWPHLMSKALEPAKQNGTLFADSIRASSLNRLHQQAGQKTAPDQSQHVNLPLATGEPSTEDISASAIDIGYGPLSAVLKHGRSDSTLFSYRSQGLSSMVCLQTAHSVR